MHSKTCLSNDRNRKWKQFCDFKNSCLFQNIAWFYKTFIKWSIGLHFSNRSSCGHFREHASSQQALPVQAPVPCTWSINGTHSQTRKKFSTSNVYFNKYFRPDGWMDSHQSITKTWYVVPPRPLAEPFYFNYLVS